ncbi:tail fiber domain-containing protein [Streptococcus sp. 517s]
MDIFRRKKFDEAMFAKNRTLAIRVGQYQSSDIKEASFDYGYIKGDTYKPGGTCAGSAKIVFTSIITTFNKLDKIYPEIGLLVDGTYEWVKMGEYFINDIEIDRNRKTTKLDIMDGMFKLNREHITDLTYPAEIRQVIKEICLKTGITLANENMDITSMNYVIENIPKEKKMTFRDVLSLATQMLGMSCFFNREGKLEIKELTDSGITITADSYFMHGLTKSEVQYQIAGITCKKDKEALTVGMRTGRSLELDNLFMSQVVLDNLYHKIKDIRYYPFNLNYQGHLLLNVGEWVTIKTNTGETFKTPVLSQSFTFKGGLRGRISADSKAGNDAQYSYAGTLTKKIVQFSEFEAQIQNQIEEADKGFDQKVAKIKKDFSDQVELAKAKTEEVKRQIADEIDKKFQSFDNASIQEARQKAEEALKNAGASSLLAQEAKRIALDSTAKFEEFKRQSTSAQTALSGDLDALKRTVTSEVNQASEYRRTTTEALSRMTGQMNGFATKSEVKQGIDGLTQTFAKMKVGGRNYIRHYDFDGLLPLSDSFPTWNYERLADPASKSGYMLKATCTQVGNGGFHKVFFDLRADEFQGKDMTWSWDMKSSRPITFYDMGFEAGGLKKNVPISTEWTRITNTFKVAFKQYYSCVFYANGWEVGDVVYIRDPQLEEGTVATTPRPAPEDGKDEILAVRTEFKQTADGLSAKMAAVESYVAQDGQRQEALRRYSREESAKQATAVRELVTRDYVGKATYQEDVRAIERKFEAITNQKNGTIATQIAKYKNAVDGRFADITSLIAGKASQADFQRVKETSQLYERILGNTNNSIADNIARMTLTNQLFQVEVGKVMRGGRNYIRNGQFKNGSKNWLEYQSVDFGLYFNYQHSQDPNNRNRPGAHFFHDSQNVADFFGLQQAFAFEGVRGEKVSVSLLVSKDGDDTYSGLRVALHYIKNKNIVGQEWQGIQSEQITSKYKRFTFTFTLSDDVDQLNLMLFGEKGKTINLYVTDVQLERGYVATDYKEALEDTDEAIRSVQSQLAGSWAVQNLTSAGSIVSQINATNNQILIEAEKIRLKGKTLLDELTAIQGYFKRLFVGEGNFAKLNAEIIGSRTITADKLIMDQAMARMFVSSDIFTDTLAAKEAFINKLRSVVVSATLLEGYKGKIGGFQIGTHEKDSSVYWITGQNQFAVGMSNGSGDWSQTALWVNWGNDWGRPSDTAWFVKHTGQMFCYNRAHFWNDPTVYGDLIVTGNIKYYPEGKILGGAHAYWLYSGSYKKVDSSNGYMYFYAKGDNYYDWIPMNKEISDRRYKHNIEDSRVSGLDVVESLKTYSYRKEYDGKIEDIACGIMAQDVQKYAPEAFYENPDGAYSYRTFELVPYLIKAIQELNQKIEKLEKTA